MAEEDGLMSLDGEGEGQGEQQGAGEGQQQGSEGAKQRPDWAPEQFWNAETGEIDTEKMAKSWTETRGQLTKAQQQKGKGKVAKDVESLLEGFAIERTRGEGDDAVNLERVGEISADDPALHAVAEAAIKHGLTDQQFKGLVADVLFSVDGLMPEPFDMDRELESLGLPTRDDAIAFTKINKSWVDGLYNSGQIGEDHHLALRQFGSTALGMQAINALREAAGEKPIPVDTSMTNQGKKSPGELSAMMNDPRYHADGPEGDAYRAQVDAEFQRAYPGNGRAPTMSAVA